MYTFIHTHILSAHYNTRNMTCDLTYCNVL